MRLGKDLSKIRKRIGKTGSLKSKALSKKRASGTNKYSDLSKIDIVNLVWKELGHCEIPESSTSSVCKFICVDTKEKLEEMAHALLSDAPAVVGVDTEDTGVGWFDSFVGMSLSWADDHNYYVPVEHVTDLPQLYIAELIPIVRELFKHEAQWVFHNYKFDFHKMKKAGLSLPPMELTHDTMLLHYVINENERHALKGLAETYIDPCAKYFETWIDNFRAKLGRAFKITKSDIGYQFIPIPIMTEYAGRDTWYTLKLFNKFYARIASNAGLRKVYKREMDVLPVLCSMEEEGVQLDQNMLKEKSKILTTEIKDVEQRVYEESRHHFNLSSPKQLREILERKGIHTGVVTPKGAMSTNEEALKNIAPNFSWVSSLLEYREKLKTKTTYTDPLLGFCDENSRIHCNYRQAVAVTGRLTCRNPSLQVIPKATGIRDAFTCPDGYWVVPIDLSQIELRLTAHYSEDAILLQAYREEEDIHTRTAAEIFGVPMDAVTPDQRTKAKPINFGIIYGIGVKKLAKQLDVPEAEARYYLNRYFEKYYGVKAFIKKYQTKIATVGYAKNYFGRIRRLDAYIGSDVEDWKRQRAFRQGVNFLIQGTAADMFKIILIRVSKILNGYKTKMVLNIHDEVVFYWHKDELSLLPKVVQAFESWKFKVPIKADVCISDKSWGEKQELLDYA